MARISPIQSIHLLYINAMLCISKTKMKQLYIRKYKLKQQFYGGSDTEVSSRVRPLASSDRWSNNLTHSAVYTVLDADRLPDTDNLRMGSTMDGERSVWCSETVWQRGRQTVGESSSSARFDRSPGPVSSSRSVSVCSTWLWSTMIRGMSRTDIVVCRWTCSDERMRRGWSRQRRQGTLPDRRRWPDSWWRLDTAVCWSRSDGDGGTAKIKGNEPPSCLCVVGSGDSLTDAPLSRSVSSSNMVYASTQSSYLSLRSSATVTRIYLLLWVICTVLLGVHYTYRPTSSIHVML